MVETAFFPKLLAKYKHVLLILLVGIGLMLLPSGGKSTSQNAATAEPEPIAKTQTLQEQLSDLLSRMEGAGRVEVLLTLATGEETLYQTDGDRTSETERFDTVLVSDSGHNETGLIRQVNPPTYLGAVVLCQGADSSALRLAITQAVANATGLGYHKITVLKMK
ncbi:MAG: hypothetical protein SOX71_06430 [Candidatus Faecousia sp.]|nr:hypothetical protein [Candidatus Faecousia sp.]